MKTISLIFILPILFISCGGDYERSTTSDSSAIMKAINSETYMKEVNGYTGGDVSIVKSEYYIGDGDGDLVVIFDKRTTEYIAVSLENFPIEEWDGLGKYPYSGPRFQYGSTVNVSEGIDRLNETIEGSTYRNLELDTLPTGELIYRHSSGIYFEKTMATVKDLAKANAIKERVLLKMNAKRLNETFGIRYERALTLSKLGRMIENKGGPKALSVEEQSQFMEEALGFTMNEAIQKASEGNIRDLLEIAAETNEITPEHLQGIVRKVNKNN